MPRSVENAQDYLRLVARLLWQPGLQRRYDFSDVVQRTLLKAHKNVDQFHGNSDEQWRGWLRAILVNELRQLRVTSHRAWIHSTSRHGTWKRCLQPTTPRPANAHFATSRWSNWRPRLAS